MHKLNNTYLLYICLYIICSNVFASSLVNLNSAREVDYHFFNDPYLMEQYAEQPLHDLTKIGVTSDGIAPDAETPIIDPSESQEVDFSFFNDPYALETFKADLPIKAKFSGYVHHASWFDSRQGEQRGAGYVYFFPKAPIFDPDCRDVNAQGAANMTVLETRMRAEFFGPEILGAETFAYIESDFFGFDGLVNLPSDSVVTRMRLRNAFVQMTWQHTKVLLGQFYHPMFIIKTFPFNVSIEAGAPISPFARNPQVRLVHFHENYEFLFAAIAQLQFKSLGPIGFSSTYLRNSRLPMLVARAAYEKKHFYGGIGATFQRLKPRIESNKGFAVNEHIDSVQATAFSTLKFEPLEIRHQITYAQNANDLLMIGGFAVSSIDPNTDKRRYTNLNTLSYWMDININRRFEPGLFIGILKNLGANRNIIQCIPNLQTGQEEQTIYTFGEGIDTLFKVSPRIRVHILPVDFAAEIAYTRATYGCINDRGKVKNTCPVANTRLIFAAYYYF